MGVKDTNAVTAIDGLLIPIEDGDALDTPQRPRPRASAKAAPNERDKKAANPLAPSAEAHFRPRERPAFPQLLVFDDSQQSAETIRIRKSPFRIGRVEGDLVIALDSQLSASHAEILLKDVNGQLQWHLKDLTSRNGTYVSVTKVGLSPNRAIMIGGSRFRFEAAAAPASNAAVPADRTMLPSTKSSKPDSSAPRLVPMDAGQNQARIVLSQPEQWIGRDPKQCSIAIDDPLVSPKHIRVFCDKKGRWHVECPEAIRGLWTQVDEVFLDRSASFQCGEQRFLFRLT